MKKQVIFPVLSALCVWAVACPAGAHPREESHPGIVVPAATASRLPQTPLPQPLPGTVVERPPLTVPVEPALPVAGIAPNKLSASEALLHVEAERDPFWLSAKQIMVRSTPELLAQHETELGRGVHYNKIFEGNIGRKQVAITFDDGPHPAYTPQILRILKQYRAKATFFVVGEQAERNPDLIRAEVAAGHSVGNHTYDHVSLVKIPTNYVGTEIKACGEILKQILGRAPHLFRPPGGVYNPQVAQIVDSLGYTMVLWTNDPGDYASPGEDVILQRTFSKINNGSIILLHDGIQQTITVLPAILQYLRDHGYQTVTVDEMLRHP